MIEVPERVTRWLLVTLTVTGVCIAWGIPGPPPDAVRTAGALCSLGAYAFLVLRVNRDGLLEYGFLALVWSVVLRTGLSMAWIVWSG